MLSKQQRRVAELLALGMSYKQAGKAMGLSDQTVACHAKKIIKQSGIKSKSCFWMFFTCQELEKMRWEYLETNPNRVYYD